MRRLAVIPLLAALVVACSSPTSPGGGSSSSSQSIGFIGGSISANSVLGRNMLPQPSSWWSEQHKQNKFSGMHIHFWGQQPEHRKWGIFRELQAANPTETIWVNILVGASMPTAHVPDLLPEDIEDLERVIARIKEYAPSAKQIIASGMPEMDLEWCPVPGPFGIPSSHLMVEYGVSQGWWIEGPELTFLDKEHTNGAGDPCHANEEGKLIHGQDLLAGIG